MFFRRYPGRSHRVRLAAAAEVEENASLGAHVEYSASVRWFVVVRQLSPGFRMRLFFRDAAGRETDLSEAAAAAIWASIESDEARGIRLAGTHVWEARNAG